MGCEASNLKRDASPSHNNSSLSDPSAGNSSSTVAAGSQSKKRKNAPAPVATKKSASLPNSSNNKKSKPNEKEPPREKTLNSSSSSMPRRSGSGPSGDPANDDEDEAYHRKKHVDSTLTAAPHSDEEDDGDSNDTDHFAPIPTPIEVYMQDDIEPGMPAIVPTSLSSVLPRADPNDPGVFSTTLEEHGTKTDSSQAALEYQQRIQAKRNEEEATSKKKKIEAFDPVRPLDSFNVTHRGLLGRCWDRRAAELIPVSFVHAVAAAQEESVLHGLRSADPIDEFPHAVPKQILSRLSAVGGPAAPPGSSASPPVASGAAMSTGNNSSFSYPTLPSLSPTRRVPRRSHWFNVGGVALDPSVGGGAGAVPSPFYYTVSNPSSPSVQRPGSTAVASPTAGSITSPTRADFRFPASAEAARESSTRDAPATLIISPEELKKMPLEKRLQLFDALLARNERYTGIRDGFAFRLGSQVSDDKSTKFLRKRHLLPARGVRARRWNRVEWFNPNLNALIAAVTRTQGGSVGMGENAFSSVQTGPLGSGGADGRANAVTTHLMGQLENISFAHQSLMSSFMMGSRQHTQSGVQEDPMSADSPGHGRTPSSGASGTYQRSLFSTSPREGEKKDMGEFPHDAVLSLALGIPTQRLLQLPGVPSSLSSGHGSHDTAATLSSGSTPGSNTTASPTLARTSGCGTVLTSLQVSCFSVSIDPFEWKEDELLRYPIDVDGSKPASRRDYGEGVITDVMYGGIMVLECCSKEGAEALETLLASMSWTEAHSLPTIVGDVRRRFRASREARAAQARKGGAAAPATKPEVNYQFRITRRVGGRPMRDAVELQEISGQFADETMRGQPTGSPSRTSSAAATNKDFAPDPDTSVSFSRVASVWVGLQTMSTVLRAWCLHLLANPEYAMPTALYLQKYSGIAPVLLHTTLTHFHQPIRPDEGDGAATMDTLFFEYDGMAAQEGAKVEKPESKISKQNRFYASLPNTPATTHEEEQTTPSVEGNPTRLHTPGKGLEKRGSIGQPRGRLGPRWCSTETLPGYGMGYDHADLEDFEERAATSSAPVIQMGGGTDRHSFQEGNAPPSPQMPTAPNTPLLVAAGPSPSMAVDLGDSDVDDGDESSSSDASPLVRSGGTFVYNSQNVVPVRGSGTVVTEMSMSSSLLNRQPSSMSVVPPNAAITTAPPSPSISARAVAPAAAQPTPLHTSSAKKTKTVRKKPPKRKMKRSKIAKEGGSSASSPASTRPVTATETTSTPPQTARDPSQAVTPANHVDEHVWQMTLLELKAQQQELEEMKQARLAMEDAADELSDQLRVLHKAFLPNTNSQELDLTLLYLKAAIYEPDDLPGARLYLARADWFSIIAAVWTAPANAVRAVEIAADLTWANIPTLGILSGLLHTTYAAGPLESFTINCHMILGAPPRSRGEGSDGSKGSSDGLDGKRETSGFLSFLGRRRDGQRNRGGKKAKYGGYDSDQDSRNFLMPSDEMGNHTFGAQCPPFYVTPEQARDTLWLVLCAVAENARGGHFMFTLRGFPGASDKTDASTERPLIGLFSSPGSTAGSSTSGSFVGRRRKEQLHSGSLPQPASLLLDSFVVYTGTPEPEDGKRSRNSRMPSRTASSLVLREESVASPLFRASASSIFLSASMDGDMVAAAVVGGSSPSPAERRGKPPKGLIHSASTPVFPVHQHGVARQGWMHDGNHAEECAFYCVLFHECPTVTEILTEQMRVLNEAPPIFPHGWDGEHERLDLLSGVSEPNPPHYHNPHNALHNHSDYYVPLARQRRLQEMVQQADQRTREAVMPLPFSPSEAVYGLQSCEEERHVLAEEESRLQMSGGTIWEALRKSVKHFNQQQEEKEKSSRRREKRSPGGTMDLTQPLRIHLRH